MKSEAALKGAAFFVGVPRVSRFLAFLALLEGLGI
jgi:hypothetical protein